MVAYFLTSPNVDSAPAKHIGPRLPPTVGRAGAVLTISYTYHVEGNSCKNYFITIFFGFSVTILSIYFNYITA